MCSHLWSRVLTCKRLSRTINSPRSLTKNELEIKWLYKRTNWWGGSGLWRKHTVKHMNIAKPYSLYPNSRGETYQNDGIIFFIAHASEAISMMIHKYDILYPTAVPYPKETSWICRRGQLWLYGSSFKMPESTIQWCWKAFDCVEWISSGRSCSRWELQDILYSKSIKALTSRENEDVWVGYGINKKWDRGTFCHLHCSIFTPNPSGR